MKLGIPNLKLYLLIAAGLALFAAGWKVSLWRSDSKDLKETKALVDQMIQNDIEMRFSLTEKIRRVEAFDTVTEGESVKVFGSIAAAGRQLKVIQNELRKINAGTADLSLAADGVRDSAYRAATEGITGTAAGEAPGADGGNKAAPPAPSASGSEGGGTG